MVCPFLLFFFFDIYLKNNTFSLIALALEKEKEKDANKRHTMSHPPDHIPDLDSPRQARSPIKKDKKDKVSVFIIFFFFSNIIIL